jgi:hypothetical protein
MVKIGNVESRQDAVFKHGTFPAINIVSRHIENGVYVDKISAFFRLHYEFIKRQSECYALVLGFTTVSILCFKSLDKLLLPFGILTGVLMLLIAFGLACAAVDEGQDYIDGKITKKGSVMHYAWALLYTSTAITAGFAIFFKIAST